MATKIGENTGSASATNVVTTNVDHAAGEQLTVHVAYTSAIQSVSGIAEPGLNGFTLVKRTASGAALVDEIWVSNGAVAIPSGTAITVTFTSTVNSVVQVIKSGSYSTTKDNEATANSTTGNPTVNFTSVGDPVLMYASSALAVAAGGQVFADGWANYGPLQHPTVNLRLVVQSLLKTPAGAGTYNDVGSITTSMTRWVTNVVGFGELPAGSGFNGLLLTDYGT